MNTIQENVESIIKKNKLLKKQVAHDLGMTPQAFSNWLHRKDDWKLSEISQICEVIKVSIVDLLMYPEKWVREDEVAPECEECKKKDEIIDNLNELIREYKQKLKAK